MDNEQNVIAYYERHSLHNLFALYTKIWNFAIPLPDNMMCSGKLFFSFFFFVRSVPSLVRDIQENIHCSGVVSGGYTSFPKRKIMRGCPFSSSVVRNNAKFIAL